MAIGLLAFASLQAQVASCPYPVLLMHGWTGSNESWEEVYTDANVEDIFGSFDTDNHVFWAMPNAEDTHVYFEDCCTFLCLFQCTYLDEDLTNDDINGTDGVFSDNGEDDDVQWVFPNEDNILSPGCLYAYSFNVGKNNDGTIFKNPFFSSTAPCDDCSDNNEASVYKQGYAVRRAIEAVLDANPGSEKVILVGHSMGGMAGREYLQRTDDNGDPAWWVDPSSPDGHKVAKFATLGSPLRGSNLLSSVTFQDPDLDPDVKRNDLPDLNSEAIRDIRWSYADGLFSDDAGVYLFGGVEADISNDYWSYDVNCDGDTDDIITGVNISGLDQGFDDPWDGTTYNPDMPLPTNLKYTYYVSDGDGAISHDRQWLFTGGDGEFDDYNNGVSVSEPNDGVDHRLSDRVNSSLFHTNQNNDVDGVMRLIDEGDYPFFAFEVDTTDWYFGLTQVRGELVPADSEYTSSGNAMIDGDWYEVTLADTVYSISVDLVSHDQLSGRVDVYGSDPGDYNNANADAFAIWNTNNVDTISTDLPIAQYLPGTYYIRVTHDLSSISGDAETYWETPYTFKISTVDECVNYLALTGLMEDGTFRAANTITSNAVLTNAMETNYFAGDTISLTHGFETPNTTIFQAAINGCLSQ